MSLPKSPEQTAEQISKTDNNQEQSQTSNHYKEDKMDYGDSLDQQNNQSQLKQEPTESQNKTQQEKEGQQSVNENQSQQQSQQQQSEQQQQQETVQKEDLKYEVKNIYKLNDYDSNSQYLHHNKRIIETFLSMFQDELKTDFKDFAENSIKNKKIDENERIRLMLQGVLGSDIPIILRAGFNSDSITIHETREDSEELFNKPNSYKRILQVLQNYAKKSGIFQENSDINDLRISYYQYIDFISYFIHTDSQVFFKRNNESDYSGSQPSIVEQVPEPAPLNDIQSGLVREIKQSIKKYQQLLENTQDVNESQIILSTISALQEQLYSLQRNEVQPPPEPEKTYTMMSSKMSGLYKSKVSLNTREIREKNMRFLYNFYTRQQVNAGPTHTFDYINHTSHVLNLGKIQIFCKQFNIYNTSPYLTKKSIPQIFRKVTNCGKEMELENFQIFLEKVGLAMFQDKENVYKNDFEKIEEFYKFIGLDDINTLKQRTKTTGNAFDIKEEDGFRLLPKDRGREYQVQKIDDKKLEELKQKKIKDKQKMLANLEQGNITKNNYSRLFQKSGFKGAPGATGMGTGMGGAQVSTGTKSNFKQTFGKKTNLGNTSFQQSQKAFNKYKYTYDNYSQRQIQAQETNIRQKQTFSWGELEKYTYEDLKQYQPGNFKPHDLLDDDEDEEDKYYLKEFALDFEKRQEELKREKQVINVENYGNVQEKIRPTQKYLMKNDPYYNPNQRYIKKNVHRHHGDHTQFEQPFYIRNKSQQVVNRLGYGQNASQFFHTGEAMSLNRKGKNSISQQYINRANQLEGYSQMRQQQQIDRLNQQNYTSRKQTKINFHY